MLCLLIIKLCLKHTVLITYVYICIIIYTIYILIWIFFRSYFLTAKTIFLVTIKHETLVKNVIFSQAECHPPKYPASITTHSRTNSGADSFNRINLERISSAGLERVHMGRRGEFLCPWYLPYSLEWTMDI